MTYDEKYKQLKSKAIAEGRKHWCDGNNGWDCGIGYWVAEFTAEETAELHAIRKAENEAREAAETAKKAAAAERKAVNEAKKAAEMGLSVEEYRAAKKVEAAKKRVAKRIEELKAELAKVTAELEAEEKKLAKM